MTLGVWAGQTHTLAETGVLSYLCYRFTGPWPEGVLDFTSLASCQLWIFHTQGLRDLIVTGISRAQRPGDRDLRDLIVTWISRAQRQGDIASYLFHALQTLSFWLVVQAEGKSPRGLQLLRETAMRLGGITNAIIFHLLV